MSTIEKSYQFIGGSFTPEASIELLNCIISGKIEFHRTRNFSTKERTGIPHLPSAEAIQQLSADRKELTDLIRVISGTGHQVRIESMIRITIDEKEGE